MIQKKSHFPYDHRDSTHYSTCAINYGEGQKSEMELVKVTQSRSRYVYELIFGIVL